jgi:GAF domain-containing protein
MLARTFVDVSDTLVADFDVADFLAVLAERCVEFLGVSEAGLMLADAKGVLRVAASSSEKMNVLELLELQHSDGPCVECFRTKTQIREEDLRQATSRWPVFAPQAVTAGFTSAYALPLRLRDQVIGSLNLLRVEPGGPDADDLLIGQALADVATIGILQHRAASEQRIIAEQLQFALNSRIVIEQAKGVLSASSGLDMDAAFQAMRQYARNHNQRLTDVAGGVADGSIAAHTVLG